MQRRLTYLKTHQSFFFSHRRGFTSTRIDCFAQNFSIFRLKILLLFQLYLPTDSSKLKLVCCSKLPEARNKFLFYLLMKSILKWKPIRGCKMINTEKQNRFSTILQSRSSFVFVHYFRLTASNLTYGGSHEKCKSGTMKSWFCGSHATHDSQECRGSTTASNVHEFWKKKQYPKSVDSVFSFWLKLISNKSYKRYFIIHILF